MDRLSPAVLDAFNLSSKGIKKEKGHYLCHSTSGLVKVHISIHTPEAIRLQHSAKEYLADLFPHTDRFRLTRDLQPYIMIGREIYVASTYPIPQRETNLENEADVLGTVSALAKLHVASESMPLDLPISPPLTEIYNRKLIELASASKQARRGSRMSDFDVAFIKHVPRANQIIKEALDCLEKTNYLKLYNQAINKGSLCHNVLKEENLPVVSNTTNIVNFSNITTDLQLNDLSALIRRYAQRGNKSISASHLIECYNKICPVPSGAKDIIYAQLVFPWSFTKLASQYYSKKRSWTPNGLINSMENVLAEWDGYEEYVRDIIY